ncbi:hypothetical protein BDF19DRAFT_240054 [Syncephalis fuscata]|nr:hypothetical protein BDF19DRAFT_240054 [Syncephalis fuscata]
MINDDDDDDDNDDSEHDQLDGSTELAMSASMELVPDPDGKASGVQKGRFSVMNDSDDSDNEEQPDGCDGNQSNNSIHQDTNDAFDKTHSHSLSQSRNLSSDLDFVASLDFSSHESTSLSRQNSGSSYLPTRPSRLNAAHLFDPPPHEPSPQQQQQQQQIDVLLLLPPDRHVPDPDTQSSVSSQHGRRGRFEVTSDDTEDDSGMY